MAPEPIQNLGVLAASDRYEGYAAERTEILKFINDNKIDNVVFVSADIHGTLVNNLTYQLAPGQAQIATSAFEITTGSVAFDAPFGQTVAELATAVGLLTPTQKAFYDSLPIANDGDSLPNDKDDFIKQIVDNGLAPLGYDPLGLNNNLPQADNLINAKLLQGDYIASHTYGWTEFNIDAETQKLTLTTYGVDAYTREELEANPNAIINRQPKIVSQFEVDPRTSGIRGTAGDDTLYGTNGDDIISGLGGNNIIYAGEGNNTIYAADGNNTIYVGAGNDRITTGNGNNQIYAGEGVNTVNTGSGNDLIYAGAGNDVINAGVGNNTIYAGEGNNTITSSGIDTIFALSGSDRFILGQGAGIATIIKFDESDRITLTGGLTFSNLNISQSGNDTFISAGADLLATLKYTQFSMITSAVFA